MSRYASDPLGFIRPEIPTLVPGPPSGEGWIHEIKDDGYRTLIVIDRARSAPSPEMAMIGRGPIDGCDQEASSGQGELAADLRFVPRRLSATIWAWVFKKGDLMP